MICVKHLVYIFSYLDLCMILFSTTLSSKVLSGPDVFTPHTIVLISIFYDLVLQPFKLSFVWPAPMSSVGTSINATGTQSAPTRISRSVFYDLLLHRFKQSFVWPWCPQWALQSMHRGPNQHQLNSRWSTLPKKNYSTQSEVTHPTTKHRQRTKRHSAKLGKSFQYAFHASQRFPKKTTRLIQKSTSPTPPPPS